MKKFIAIIFLSGCIPATAQNVGIGTNTPNASAQLEISSNSKGLLIPRMTSAERGAIASPAQGLLIYQTDGTTGFYVNRSGLPAIPNWSLVTEGINQWLPGLIGGSIYSINSGNVGIGTTTPAAKLDVNGQIKMSGGTPGAGKLLESDANGLASWVDKSSSFLPVGASGNTMRHTGITWTANSLLYNNGTNIGINTTSPDYKLDVNGRMRLGHNAVTAGVWLDKSDNTEGAFIGMINDTTAGYFGNGTSGSWKLSIDVKNAQMGIGVTDPSAPLSFSTALGDKIALWGDASGGHYGLGIQGSLLQMYSSANNADIAFGYGSSSSFTEAMRVKGNGNVGVGTNNPGYKFTVSTTAGNYGFMHASGSVNVGSYADASGGWLGTASNHPLHFFTNNGSQQLTLSQAGNFGIGLNNPSVPLSFANTLSKKISLYHGASGDAGLGVFANELRINSDYNGADITFGYDHYTNGFTERMRVKGNGNVGIGTASPNSKLEVFGSGYGIYQNDGTVSVGTYTSASGGWLGTTTNHPLHFFTANSGEKMTLSVAGNLGVGTTVPVYRLDVNGRMRLRHNGVTSGVWFNNSSNVEASFIGQYTDNLFGIYGNAWNLAVNRNDGTVYLGSNNLDNENLNAGTGYKLRVFGKIIGEEIRVQLKAAWPDYVFEKNYQKLSLNELEQFVNENKHLPNIPSAKEIEKDGHHLGEIQVKLIEKIEELTLYIIEQQKKIEALEKKIR